MEIEEAKAICRNLAEHRKRWGKLAGNNAIPEFKIREALVMLYEKGLFDVDDNRTDVVAANRAKGAAEARAKNYKNQLDEANKRIEELTIALEDCKKIGTKKGLFG